MMCRILAVWGVKDKLDTVGKLARAFVKACQADPKLQSIAGIDKHCDGWGVAAVFSTNTGVHIAFNRFYSPSIEDTFKRLERAVDRILDLASYSREYAMVFHCRKAGRTEPIGISHCHPYHIETSYYELFVAHNGSFRKDDLVYLIGRHAQLYTDSALAAQLYARMLEGGAETLDALRRLTFYARTACNLVVLLVDRANGRTSLAYSSLICSDDPKRLDYYRTFIHASKELFVYASSTIVDMLGEDIGIRWEIVAEPKVGKIGYFEQGLHITQTVKCPPIEG